VASVERILQTSENDGVDTLRDISRSDRERDEELAIGARPSFPAPIDISKLR